MDEKLGSNVVDVGVDLSEFYMSVEWDILEVPAVRWACYTLANVSQIFLYLFRYLMCTFSKLNIYLRNYPITIPDFFPKFIYFPAIFPQILRFMCKCSFVLSIPPSFLFLRCFFFQCLVDRISRLNLSRMLFVLFL